MTQDTETNTDTDTDTDTDTPEEQSPTPDDDTTPYMDGVVDADALGVALDALAAAHDEATMTFTESGLTAQNVDPASVLMAIVEVPAEVWESYGAGQLELGIDIGKLDDMGTMGDTTALAWNGEATDYRMHVESGPIDAHISTVDPDLVETETPNDAVYEDMQAAFEIPAADLRTALTATTRFVGNVSEVILNDDFLGLRKVGDTDKVQAGFDNATITDDPADPVRVLMSEEYMKELRQAIPDDDTILHVQIAEDWPMVVRFDHHGVEVEWVQAPRIQSQ